MFRVSNLSSEVYGVRMVSAHDLGKALIAPNIGDYF